MPKVAIAPTEDQSWPVQGAWTYDDYLRLPEDGRRYEIIEGVLYVVNAPNYNHQFAVSQLPIQMGVFAQSNNLGQVLTAPFEIHLSEATRPVQPDVIFLKAGREPSSNIAAFEGVPDLLIEVIPPSSLRTDRHIKFDIYEQAGVPEYWIVNPKTRSVEVYTLSNREYALLGEFVGDDLVESAVLEGIGIVTKTLFPIND